MHYDFYGKHSFAYDQSTFLDAPSGKAAGDYELWYNSNPEVAE